MGPSHSSGRLHHLSGEPLALLETPTTQSNDGFLPEILEQLASFLVGFDVLQLSHVCRAFRTTFSDSSVWEYRLPQSNPRAPRLTIPSNPAWCEAQSQYFASRSFYFRGLNALPTEKEATKRFVTKQARRRRVERLCGDVCELPNSLLPSNGRVSFELWFSLGSSTSQGGILLGHQSQSCLASDQVPSHFQRIVHVDPEHNLYCSVLPSKPVVAYSLEPTRWYHLVLTFDGKRQCVYLNGQLAGSGVGAGNAHEKWHWTPYTQVGTGYISASSVGKPTPGYAGWYPFEGLIDDFRVWYSALEPEEVQRLAKHEPSSSKPVYILSSDRLFRQEGVQRVQCSRPVERQATIHYLWKDTGDTPSEPRTCLFQQLHRVAMEAKEVLDAQDWGYKGRVCTTTVHNKVVNTMTNPHGGIIVERPTHVAIGAGADTNLDRVLKKCALPTVTAREATSALSLTFLFND